jgi:cytochrome c-type biogenesis protein CcmH
VLSTFDQDAPRFRGSAAEAVLVEQRDALRENPDDLAGWQRLSLIYRELGDYYHALQALEQVWNRTEVPDDYLKLSYAEALLISNRENAGSLAGELIEDVLAQTPDDEAALLLGGIAAVETGRRELAIERFTELLDKNPPPEIEDMVRRQIMALSMPAPQSGDGQRDSGDGPALKIEVSLAEGVSLEAFGPNARLYVLARAADSPMPIAVTQNPLSSLPGTFTLNDGNSMAGRSLTQFETVTVVARVSASGSATASPGDVYDEITVAIDSDQPIRLVIDKLVPEG